jgi:hypothetical protein
MEGGELLRRLTQGHFDQRSAEEPIRERVVGEDGIARTHRREGCRPAPGDPFRGGDRHPPRLWGRGLDSVFPLDTELNLPPDKYSHGLREAVMDDVIRGSFDEAVGPLERSGGGRIAKRQAAGRRCYNKDPHPKDFGFSSRGFSPGSRCGMTDRLRHRGLTW